MLEWLRLTHCAANPLQFAPNWCALNIQALPGLQHAQVA